ncbi:unnamed protein product [Acanthocheilonema viteae]|uniref:Uncharacterized protein n=1 Tax=Acanthocheilonema viteae TaxID=6277 RepID=A0A498SLN2_ACAVI|nr:unnamed protein product [Acanthocheilonema viteae]
MICYVELWNFLTEWCHLLGGDGQEPYDIVNILVLFPEIVQSCGSFQTSKRQDDYDNDLKHVTSLEPTVRIIWHEIGNPNTCELGYKGYQKNYRISPDLGYYIGCQKALSQYISQLAIRKTPIWNTSNANCPLKSLPKNYEDYLACDFTHGKWSVSCDDAEFSLNINANWSQPISFIIHYRIRLDNHIHYMSLIANRTVDDWMTDTFVLIPSNAIHEMSWESYGHHFENCIPFQIEQKCFESNDAHLPVKRNIFMILVVVNLYLL